MSNTDSLGTLEETVGRYPTSAEAWGPLGEAYYAIAQFEPASIAFREATRYAPGSARAWFGLATSLFWLDRCADALAPAREAVRLAPDFPPARLYLGRVLTALDRPLEAVAELEEAARLAPGWDAALGHRGLVQYRIGRHAAAAASLEAALRIDPDAPLWAALGASLLELGQWEGAANALETAIFARPDCGGSWARLGVARRRLDRPVDAADALAHAIKLGFHEAWVWYEAGKTGATLGDSEIVDQAQVELQRLDPELARKLAEETVGGSKC